MAAHSSPCFSPAVSSQLSVENEPDEIQVKSQPPWAQNPAWLPAPLTRSRPGCGSTPHSHFARLLSVSGALQAEYSHLRVFALAVPSAWNPHHPFQSCNLPPPTKQTQSSSLPLLLPQMPLVLSHSCIIPYSLYLLFIVLLIRQDKGRNFCLIHPCISNLAQYLVHCRHPINTC